MLNSIVWVSPWERICGISDYSKNLWPAVAEAVRARGWKAELVSIDQFRDVPALVKRLSEFQPSIIHFQHEFGLYGGKNPPFYWFPRLLEELRQKVPAAKLSATAHTVLSADYRFPVAGRGWQIPIRFAANTFVLPFLREYWGQKTWSLDGVVVHSEYQVEVVRSLGADRAQMIAHFVPDPETSEAQLNEIPGMDAFLARPGKKLAVFGFFTPEKGQDVAIEALAKLGPDVSLILAGGVRRGVDQRYYDHCLERIRALKLQNKVFVTGFLDRKYIPALYRAADLVLVPFRETSGSGSIATAIAHDAPILASDLLLNRELEAREPGAFAFFRSGDAADCARRVQELLSTEDRLRALAAGTRRYRERYGIKPVAEQHAVYYASLMKTGKGTGV